MTRRMLPALLLVSCHQVAGSPASPPVLAAAPPVAAPPALPLRTEVARELTGIRFGLVAVLERGDRSAAVTWPAIRDGKILDDDIIAWGYVGDGAGWRLEEGNRGGASEIAVHRPANVPVGVQVGGGVSCLEIDDRQVGAAGGPISLDTDGWSTATARYDLQLTGGASELSVST